MIVNEPSRMYTALRCIESELAKENPSIAAIRAIVLEAGRELRPTPRAVDAAKPSYAEYCAEIEAIFNRRATNASRWAEARRRSMANFGEMKIELTEESIAAMKEFSAALNHFSDEMSKTVVAFQEFQSAQQSVQRMGLLARISKWFGAIAHR